MATAKFFDRYSSTLSGSYTSGGSSLSVTSATGLPTGGDFWVLVQAEGANTEEVFKVTARSGTTLTVTGAQAGTSASNHASGATIRGFILTDDSITQLKKDVASSMTVSAFDALSGNDERQVVYLSDGLYTAVYNGSTWDYYHGGHKMTPPVLGDFTSVNFGTSTADTDTKATRIITQTGSGNNWRIKKKAAPSTPYTIITCWKMILHSSQPLAGFVWRQSSDGKLVVLAVSMNNDNPVVNVQSWSSPTAWNGNYVSTALPRNLGYAEVWLKATDNGTNRITYIGNSKYNMYEVNSHSRTDYMTADEVGFGVNNENNALAQQCLLLSWEQS